MQCALHQATCNSFLQSWATCNVHHIKQCAIGFCIWCILQSWAICNVQCAWHQATCNSFVQSWATCNVQCASHQATCNRLLHPVPSIRHLSTRLSCLNSPQSHRCPKYFPLFPPAFASLWMRSLTTVLYCSCKQKLDFCKVYQLREETCPLWNGP